MRLAFFNVLALSSLFSSCFLHRFSHCSTSLLLLSSYSLFRTLRVLAFVFASSSYRKTSSMSDAPVATDFHQTLDIQRNVSSQVTFYYIFLVNDLSDLTSFGQILNSCIRINPCLFQNRVCRRSANTIDICQTNFNSLLSGKSTPAIRAIFPSCSHLPSRSLSYLTTWGVI